MTPSEILKAAAEAKSKPDLQVLVDAIPYAAYLGIRIERKGSEITAVLPFAPHIIGNPVLPALHGGVVGGFLETTAVLHAIFELGGEGGIPRPVDVNVDYLRSGKPVDTYARAVIAKQGRRVVNVRAEAWQDDRERPIAALRGHFLLKA